MSISINIGDAITFGGVSVRVAALAGVTLEPEKVRRLRLAPNVMVYVLSEYRIGLVQNAGDELRAPEPDVPAKYIRTIWTGRGTDIEVVSSVDQTIVLATVTTDPEQLREALQVLGYGPRDTLPIRN